MPDSCRSSDTGTLCGRQQGPRSLGVLGFSTTCCCPLGTSPSSRFAKSRGQKPLEASGGLTALGSSFLTPRFLLLRMPPPLGVDEDADAWGYAEGLHGAQEF